MIVLTGASGKLGQLVAAELANRTRPRDVRLGSRHVDKLQTLAAAGFKTAKLDFDDPASLSVALRGADTVIVISGDSPVETRIRQHRNAIDAARQAGASHILYTSFVNAVPESLFPFAAIHTDTESCLEASGILYTVLRANLYAENLPLESARATGALRLPGAHGKVAYLTRADVAAAVAGAALATHQSSGIHDLTGTQAFDLFEVAELATNAWGIPIAAQEIDTETFATAFAARGVPAYAVKAVSGLWQAVGADELSQISDDAPRLAGRPLESLASYIQRNGPA